MRFILFPFTFEVYVYFVSLPLFYYYWTTLKYWLYLSKMNWCKTNSFVPIDLQTISSQQKHNRDKITLRW